MNKGKEQGKMDEDNQMRNMPFESRVQDHSVKKLQLVNDVREGDNEGGLTQHQSNTDTGRLYRPELGFSKLLGKSSQKLVNPAVSETTSENQSGEAGNKNVNEKEKEAQFLPEKQAQAKASPNVGKLMDWV